MSLPSLDGDLTVHTPEINVDVDTGNIDIDADVKLTGSGDEPISMLVIGDATKPVSMMMLGDAGKPISILAKGDPKNPIAASFELVNFPRFSVTDLQNLMSMRISLPGHHQLCLKLLGRELFSICLSGEGQAITQPYVPNAYERCEVSCCEDTTPFPEAIP